MFLADVRESIFLLRCKRALRKIRKQSAAYRQIL